MKLLKKDKLLFIFLSIVIVTASVLPVILSNDATITVNSIPAIVFAICSFIYAIIAFLNKEHGNLFVLGKNKLFIAFLRSYSGDDIDTDSDEYKKEFVLAAFVFCASIPLYIPLAFFSKSFYMAISSTLSVTLLRILLTFVLVLIPRLTKKVQEKRQRYIKDEVDRKDQERRESMGKGK